MSDAKSFVTPVGELRWIFISGNGKKDLNGNDRFTASLYLKSDNPACETLVKQINDFWEENKPKKAVIKSLGYRTERGDDGEPTGETSFNFWTGTKFPDGGAKVVKTYNAGNRAEGQKPAEIFLGNKKIGNGSTGSISGAMAIYDNGPAARGVTLYLNAIQLIKFLEYTQDAGFAASEEGGFDGLEATDEESGFSSEGEASVAEEKSAESEVAKPRL